MKRMACPWHPPCQLPFCCILVCQGQGGVYFGVLLYFASPPNPSLLNNHGRGIFFMLLASYLALPCCPTDGRASPVDNCGKACGCPNCWPGCWASLLPKAAAPEFQQVAVAPGCFASAPTCQKSFLEITSRSCWIYGSVFLSPPSVSGDCPQTTYMIDSPST